MSKTNGFGVPRLTWREGSRSGSLPGSGWEALLLQALCEAKGVCAGLRGVLWPGPKLSHCVKLLVSTAGRGWGGDKGSQELVCRSEPLAVICCVWAAGVSGLQMLCKCCMSHWGCSEQTCCVGVQPQESFTPPTLKMGGAAGSSAGCKAHLCLRTGT